VKTERKRSRFSPFDFDEKGVAKSRAKRYNITSPEMFPPSSKRIIGIVFLIGISVIASLARAEAQNPVIPTQTPPAGKKTSHDPAEIDVDFKDPVQVQAQVKPVDVEFSKELRVNATGASELKLDWKGGQIPLELRWPSEPIRISIVRDDQNGGNNRNAPCGETGSGQSYGNQSKTASTSVDFNKWQEKIDKLEKQLSDDAAARRKELQDQRKAGQLSEEQFNQKIQNLEKDVANRASQIPEVAIAKENSSQRWWWFWKIISCIFACGIAGGLAIHTLEYLRTKKPFMEALKKERNDARRQEDEWRQHSYEEREKLKEEFDARSRERAERLKKLNDELFWASATHWSVYEWLPVLFLGIIAALAVPGALLFIPGINLQSVAEDPFRLVSLCSFCFLAAMIGEPFIEFVLQKLRNLTTERSEPQPRKSRRILG
jgi:hypothetical protein